MANPIFSMCRWETGARGRKVLLPVATQPFAPDPELESWLVYSTGEGGAGLPEPNPQGPTATLASSISILDLARRSLRSKSRCFCSRSASRSVTCFCRSASFWRSSVIWVQRQREGVRERDCPRDDTAEQDGGGGDALTTAEFP